MSICARFLQNKAFAVIVGQATGLVVLYFVITALATALCFLLLENHFDYSLRDSTELTLFFAFNAVNLPWLALRYFSIAIDEFYFFETLEALRRGLSMIALLALLLGLPVFAFLVLINCAWIVGFCIAIAKLYERGVLGGTFRNSLVCFVEFFRSNRRHILNSAVYSASETFIYSFPYFLVP